MFRVLIVGRAKVSGQFCYWICYWRVLLEGLIVESELCGGLGRSKGFIGTCSLRARPVLGPLLLASPSMGQRPFESKYLKALLLRRPPANGDCQSRLASEGISTPVPSEFHTRTLSV